MNTGSYVTMAVLGGALNFSSYGDKVRLEDLPAEVQNGIRAQAGSAPVEDIDRETKNGRTTYEIAFKKNGQHTEVRLNERGEPLNPPAKPAPVLDSRKITYNELPEAVRKTAESHLREGSVNDVDRHVNNGEVTYEIGFKRDDGTQQELVVASNGSVIHRPGAARRRVIGEVSFQSISYVELPAAVRTTAESRLRNGNVSYVDRIVKRGRTAYEIGFEKESGGEVILIVAEDGKVVKNTAVGAAASNSTGGATSGNRGSRLTLSESQPVSQRGAVPSEIRNALRRESNGAAIDTVQRGSVDGKSIYHASFIENDRPVVVQFDERGRVLYDSRH